MPLLPPLVVAMLSRLQKFHVLVDNLDICELLVATTPPPNRTWSVFLKVDCGNERG